MCPCLCLRVCRGGGLPRLPALVTPTSLLPPWLLQELAAAIFANADEAKATLMHAPMKMWPAGCRCQERGGLRCSMAAPAPLPRLNRGRGARRCPQQPPIRDFAHGTPHPTPPPAPAHRAEAVRPPPAHAAPPSAPSSSSSSLALRLWPAQAAGGHAHARKQQCSIAEPEACFTQELPAPSQAPISDLPRHSLLGLHLSRLLHNDSCNMPRHAQCCQ